MVKHLSWCASAVVSYTKTIKQPATLLEKPWNLFSTTFLHFLVNFYRKLFWANPFSQSLDKPQNWFKIFFRSRLQTPLRPFKITPITKLGKTAKKRKTANKRFNFYRALLIGIRQARLFSKAKQQILIIRVSVNSTTLPLGKKTQIGRAGIELGSSCP